MEQELLSKKIESIEQELSNLKTLLHTKSKGKTVSLKGMLKGIKITDKDIIDSQDSLFHSSE